MKSSIAAEMDPRQEDKSELTEAFTTRMMAESVPTPAQLVAIAGPMSGMCYTLLSDDNTVGRAAGNSIRLSTMGVSKLHCRITRDSGARFCIVDAGSLNGTTVNGRRLEPDTPLELTWGDTVCICEWTFLFVGGSTLEESDPVEGISVDSQLAKREADGLLADFAAALELRRCRKR